jgi:hypothetical protein
MLPRNLRVIDANVGLESTAEDDLFALERDRHSDQLSAQENKRRFKVASE